jgi:hypothetical protein
MAKLIYSSSREKGDQCGYAQALYKEHLKVWNGFKEYDNPTKNSFEAFLDVYHNLLDEIKENGFDGSRSQIPISNDNSFLNGAHRVAACITYNKEPTTISGINGKDGQWDCGFNFFKRLGLSPNYMDSMALHYLTLKSNTKIVTLYPSANPQYDSMVNRVIQQYGKIVYYKPIQLSIHGLFNLTRQLYKGENWAGNWSNNFPGFRQKTNFCFKSNVLTRIFLVEFKCTEDSVTCKNEIRKIFKISNHSVHINDHHHETIRLGRILFNNNSIHYLNNLKLVRFPKFESLLEQFRSLIPPNKEEDYCVTASGVLAAYGLRGAQDVDYLHWGDKLASPTHLISSHNEYGVGRYPHHRDEIIFNPTHHFWYDNIKFTSLDIVKQLKEKRNEPKDVVDVSLIKEIYA